MSDTSLPVVIELPESLTPEIAARRAQAWSGVLFLDSSLRGERLGRYSFVAAGPCGSLRRDRADVSIFDAIAAELREFKNPDRRDLPPFQGGIAGMFGYELCQSLEGISPTRFDDLPTPVADLTFYDVVAAFDHEANRSWIISSGFPEMDQAKRLRHAQDRAEFFYAILDTPREPKSKGFDLRDIPAHLLPIYRRHHAQTLTSGNQILAPQYEVPGAKGLTSNFPREQYLAAIQRVIDYIHAGDAFQVNLSQRLLFPSQGDPFETYLKLRQRNPAPFSAFFDGGYYQIASASPERFLFARNGEIETRPIKGTRRRLSSPEADLFRGDELRASEKDRAENVMIVDLLRNDLSRICTDDSVKVTELCRLETYAFVQHLVSTVVGKLRDDVGLADAVKACFPGGSITGAPKVRAMQIISELEPTPRGPYCGSLGYLGFNGAMDLNILIRTMTAAYGQWQFPVGGGIVADSDPESEYEETLAKAVGLVRSLAK